MIECPHNVILKSAPGSEIKNEKKKNVVALESSVTFDLTWSAALFKQHNIKAITMTVTVDVVLCSKSSLNFVAFQWLLFCFDFAEEVQAKVKQLIL